LSAAQRLLQCSRLRSHLQSWSKLLADRAMDAPSSSAVLVHSLAHTQTSTGPTTTKHTTTKPNLDRKVGPTMDELEERYVKDADRALHNVRMLH